MKIILALLFVVIQAIAVDSNSSETSRLINGTSMGKYLKPGLAIEIAYTSTRVVLGESSDVNITLSTSAIESGTLKVQMTADKALNGLSGANLEFSISEDEKSFPIQLQLSSGIDGIHYVNVFAEVEGRGTRAFAVPVYVGDTQNKTFNKMIQKTEQGDNISVSSAQEEIIDN